MSLPELLFHLANYIAAIYFELIVTHCVDIKLTFPKFGLDGSRPGVQLQGGMYCRIVADLCVRSVKSVN